MSQINGAQFVAAMALQGILANPDSLGKTAQELAREARIVSTALLEELAHPTQAVQELEAPDAPEKLPAVPPLTMPCTTCAGQRRALVNYYQLPNGEVFSAPPSVPVQGLLVSREYACDVCEGLAF